MIRKIIEEWNPYNLEDSIYGFESFEIYKCIIGRNTINQITPEEIASYLFNRFGKTYTDGNFEISINECQHIANKILHILDSNKKGE